jgi:anaerobic glycerol-3-phosphate dehydrogenase
VENAQLNLQLTQGLIDIRALTPASLALQNAKVSLASVATLENQNQEPYRSLNQKVEELELALREATPGLFDRLQRIVK